jgi:enterochelin esterase family protein
MTAQGGPVARLAILALLLASPRLLAAAPATPEAGRAPFASLAELDAAMAEVERGGDVEAFWERVKAAGAMPLLFGEAAVFLHRSKAAKVEWRGDFTGWRPSAESEGRRLGRSDLFTFRRAFLPGTRLDYKIVETTEDWIVDPLNPNQQLGGYGPNSEVRLPGWTAPAHVERRPGVPRGAFGPPERVESRKLGYGVNVRVYVAAAGKKAGGRMPILYVTDGSDYWHDEMGGLTATLDNLVAEGRIPPLVAVFVDPWDPGHEVNRRETEFLPNPDDPSRPIEACPFCEFLVEELAPRIEGRHRIDPSRRGILGTSLGGLNAAFLGYRYPAFFRLLAIQSPSVWRQPWIAEGIAKAEQVPKCVAIDIGLYEEFLLPGARGLRDAYQRRGVDLRYVEVPDGHSWGHWRATAAPMLEFLYRDAEGCQTGRRSSNQ